MVSAVSVPWCSSPDCLADRSIGKAACPRLSTLIALVRPPALRCANARHGTASTVGTMVKLKQSDVLNVSDHAAFPAWPHAACSSTWLGFTCLGNQTKRWALEFVSISNHTARVLQQPSNLGTLLRHFWRSQVSKPEHGFLVVHFTITVRLPPIGFRKLFTATLTLLRISVMWPPRVQRYQTRRQCECCMVQQVPDALAVFQAKNLNVKQ